MSIKRYLGLDLGTNSIGWALVEIDHENRIVTILGLGSRIIPMDEQEISAFDKGNKIVSAAADKTAKKSSRKNNYRFAIRRDRLHCVLNLLSMLPKDYSINVDFETVDGKRNGKFKKYKEPKLAYDQNRNFLFRESYEDMCKEFFSMHPNLRRVKRGKISGIPHDWTLYYLRKKALTQEISLNELSWVILSFIQRRGYEQVSGVDIESNDNKDKNNSKPIVEDLICHVSSKQVCPPLKNSETERAIFTLEDKNGVKVLDATCAATLLNIGSEVFLKKVSLTDDEGNVTKNQYEISYVTTDKEKDADYEITFELGEDFVQKGRVSKKKKDDKTDWKILKVQSEADLDRFNDEHHCVGVGSYIYDALLKNPNLKIHGDLLQTIERDYYRDELQAILNKQAEYHSVLKDLDKSMLGRAADLLYPHNERHNKFLKNKDLIYMLCEDVVFYQRDLKSKKSSISFCPFEYEHYEEAKHLKVTHKGNPLYEEFSLRDRLNNLRIRKNESVIDGKLVFDVDVTELLLTPNVKDLLYEELKNRKDVTEEQLFSKLNSIKRTGDQIEITNIDYSWNYDQNYKFPCNPYRHEIFRRLKRVKGLDVNAFLDFKQHIGCNTEQTTEYQLWQLFYSVRKRKLLENGLQKLVLKQVKKYCLAHNIEADVFALAQSICDNLKQFEGYKNDYGKFSERMIKRILPYMKKGHDLSSACKEVYGYYNSGEIKDAIFDNPKAIRGYVQNSFAGLHLNNPVVEKVVRETLLVVADIWDKFSEKDSKGNTLPLFDSIKIELGRQLKKNRKQKEKITSDILRNTEINKRVYALLKELKKEIVDLDIHSMSARRRMHIYEEGALAALGKDEYTEYPLTLPGEEKPITKEEVDKISKLDFSKVVSSRKDRETYVTFSEIRRYRLWLEQRYCSPYTGNIIPLSKLFDKKYYDVDHVFPRKKVTLNAMSNLVLCETEVNKKKSDMTGLEFIKKSEKGCGTVTIRGKKVAILSVANYESNVNKTISDSRKRKILLSEEIPSNFTNSQGANSQFIARQVKELLSAVVSPNTTEGKYAEVLSTNGAVTSTLKKDWHLNDVWNRLMLPRFERLNQWVEGTPFTREVNGHIVPCVPEPYCHTFEIKRIDHRHHALDALIIALTDKDYLDYINTIESGKEREGLKAKLMKKGEYHFLPPQQQYQQGKIVKYKYLYKPQNKVKADFQQIAYDALSDVVVTFKQERIDHVKRQRINYYKRPNAEGVIEYVKEVGVKEKNKYAFRIQMHDATLRGLRHERTVKVADAIKNNKEIVQREVRLFVEEKRKEGWTTKQLMDCLEKKYPYILVKEEALSTRWKKSIYNLDLQNDFPYIADKRITEIIEDHIKSYIEDCDDRDSDIKFQEAAKKALCEDGIKHLNAIIEEKYHHKPIYVYSKVEAKGTAKPLSSDTNSVKNKQFAITADNPYKVLSVSEKNGKRQFEIFDIDNIEDNANDSKGVGKLFTLRVGDLVYVPNEDELLKKTVKIKDLDKDRIYKLISMNSTTSLGKPDVNFIPHRIANLVFSDNKSEEYKLMHKIPGTSNTYLQGELSITRADSRIKVSIPYIIDDHCIEISVIRDICWKLEVDSLGNISKIKRRPND